jgi:predicted aspartyl protease
MSIFAILLMIAISGCASSPRKASDAPASSSLPSSWTNGDLEQLEAEARSQLEQNPKDGRALGALLFSAHLKGDHSKAAELYLALPATDRTPTLVRATIDSLIHSGKFSAAKNVSSENIYKFEYYGPMLEAREKNPMRIRQQNVVELKFVSGSKSGLDPYMPGIEGELRASGGKAYVGTIRIDTGADFLILSKKRAEALGLNEVSCQQGRQAENKTQVCWSQLRRLRLGTLRLTNVPVSIVYSLPGDFEPILGTNILQQFKSELNYVESKLVLSPRSGKFPAGKANCIRVPFLMWADHFMIAKGSFGPRKNLNYFIDSGLVSVAPGGRQSAIKVATEDLKQWNVPFKEDEKIIDPSMSIGLGELEKEGHLVTHSPLDKLGFDFGGVRLHGLLGHGFYKDYVWRIDFDEMQYQFCR